MRKFICDLAGSRVKQESKYVRPQDRRGQHPNQGGGQHAGLLLQRYLCENATGEGGNPEEKRAILQAAINAASNPEVRELYKAAYARWQKSLPELTAANELETLGRLIVGLGTDNVLETGIRLHHTYGMPILPGSALKGMAAHYCDQVWGEQDKESPSDHAIHFRGPRKEDRKQNRRAESQGKYHKLLFGNTDDSGGIVFHDAWFVPDSESEPLKPDVMTPHHPKWLDGAAPPTDFDSPTPVPFLSVAGQFHVAVSWYGPESDKAKGWTEQAFELLCDALGHWGIGGKTTSGYGRFDLEKLKADREVKAKQREKEAIEAERLRQLEAMSPIERSIKELLELHPNKAETRVWFKLYEELKKPEGRFTSPEDRIEVAKRVKAGMQETKVWKDKGKDGERKTFIRQILGE